MGPNLPSKKGEVSLLSFVRENSCARVGVTLKRGICTMQMYVFFFITFMIDLVLGFVQGESGKEDMSIKPWRKGPRSLVEP